MVSNLNYRSTLETVEKIKLFNMHEPRDHAMKSVGRRAFRKKKKDVTF